MTDKASITEKKLKRAADHVRASEHVQKIAAKHVAHTSKHGAAAEKHRLQRKNPKITPARREFHRQMERFHLKQVAHHEASGKHLVGLLDSIKKI